MGNKHKRWMYQGYRLTSARRFLVANAKIQDWHWKYWTERTNWCTNHQTVRVPGNSNPVTETSSCVKGGMNMSWAEPIGVKIQTGSTVLCWWQSVLQWARVWYMMQLRSPAWPLWRYILTLLSIVWGFLISPFSVLIVTHRCSCMENS